MNFENNTFRKSIYQQEEFEHSPRISANSPFQTKPTATALNNLETYQSYQVIDQHDHKNSKQAEYSREIEQIIISESVKSTMDQFMSPAKVLGLLLKAKIGGSKGSSAGWTDDDLRNQIQALTVKAEEMRNEMTQAQQMLQIRDQLYERLDQLRDERQKMEAEAGKVTQDTLSSFQEWNEQLRLRIDRIREYIHKMTIENNRLEDALKHRTTIEEQAKMWQPPIRQVPQNDGNWNKVEAMLTRLQTKQDQAWNRVREQQGNIEKRNKQARIKKSKVTYHRV